MACVCNRNECILCNSRVFDGLAPDRVCQARGLIAHVSYPSRALLFHERAHADRLFILRSGYVKLTTSLADGREQILRLACPGQMFGFESLNDRFYPYSARALTAVEVCTVRHRDMMQLLEQDTGVSLRMIRMLNEELERSKALIRDLGLKSSTERLASFILSLAPKRRASAGDFALPLTRKEISEMLGLTEETVSRAVARLRRAGLVRTARGWVRVLDAERLRMLAEGAGHVAPAWRGARPCQARTRSVCP